MFVHKSRTSTYIFASHVNVILVYEKNFAICQRACLVLCNCFRLLIGVDAVQVYLPLILGDFVNAVTALESNVARYAYIYLALVVCMTLMRYAYRYILQRMALVFDYDLRKKTFSELLKVPNEFLMITILETL